MPNARCLPLLFLLAAASAPQAADAGRATKPTKPARPVPRTGVITGSVAWTGGDAVRARPVIDMSSDAWCARSPRPAEDVVVGDAGGLRDVFVFVAPGTAGQHPVPAEPVVVTQDGCVYAPRVVGVRQGQALEVRNADQTFHNVRGNRGSKVAFNLAQNKGAAPIVRTDLGEPGDKLELACDVHPWMRAWAFVIDHPYFAVTGDDGAFSITGLAPGTYELTAWHPRLGARTTKVKVKKGKRAARARFSFDRDDCTGC